MWGHGSSGRRGDVNVYQRSIFHKMMKQKQLHPPGKCHEDEMEDKLPLFFVGDAWDVQ